MTIMRRAISRFALLLAFDVAVGMAALPDVANAQEGSQPAYLRDRGTGIPTSMFGT